jgi:glucosamine-phosphate N-acetyltransferase
MNQNEITSLNAHDSKENTHNANFIEETLKTLNIDSENLRFRLLEKEDYHKSYFELLSQLTVADKPDFDSWLKRYKEIQDTNLTKFFVVEDLKEEKIIATITCYTELKFIRNLGKICHIEDFVIDKAYRNKKLGSKLINTAINYAKHIGYYKMVLQSRGEVISFYEKFGFSKNSQAMAYYLNKEK